MQPHTGRITTILFDCDNTLVQSESLAFEACADLNNEILASRSISLRFTGPQLQHDFVGQNFQTMIRSLEAKYDFCLDLNEAELDEYAGMEDDRVIAKLVQKLQPCTGANAVLERLVSAEDKHYRLAVVSSSALSRVHASLDKAGQARFFGESDVFSAADSLLVPTSKPSPAIYLHALRQLEKTAAESIAIEDSRSGVAAACRASILTLGYTGAYHEGEERERMQRVLREAGCKLVMDDWAELEQCLERIEKGAV